ncbi:hypothetical protein [Altericista sp. CCNU0014]|uniref:hypothetical protein n=1 Tax=Altericista sp. CCNU0014 TaxID=3082949 RepID=UPI00384BD342
MNDDNLFDERPELDRETTSINQLNDLGNRAVQLGLIAGHGYHGGKYEILRQGKAILLSSQEAATYLAELIASVRS